MNTKSAVDVKVQDHLQTSMHVVTRYFQTSRHHAFVTSDMTA